MRRGVTKGVRALVAGFMAAVLACSLCACKPTDFFTEVIISSFADEVDYDNPTVTYVNSPDAEEESKTLAAIDWAESSERTEDVQNLVVYSSEPTVDLSTHHSVFDLSPIIPGIEASDGVRLLYSEDAPLEHESEGSDQEPPDSEAEEESIGGQESSPEAFAALSDYVQQQQASSSSGSPDSNSQGESFDVEMSAGGGSDLDVEMTAGSGEPNPEMPDESGNPDPDLPQEGNASQPDNPANGPSEAPQGGYDGTYQPIYNPNDAFQRVRRVQNLAVLGSDAAVLAQAIGGQGAICAMSQYAYLGLDSSGVRLSTVSTFADVFADEAAGIQLLWNRDGSSPSDLVDVDALVEACGINGLIVFDQNLGNLSTFFTDEQYQKIADAGIQMAPVDMSSAQGIIDAAYLIGDALSESSACVQDAKTMSRAYASAVQDIVSAVNATHGSLGSTYCYLATDAEGGLSYTGSPSVDVSDVVLFTSLRDGDMATYWMQVAGLRCGWSIDAYHPGNQLSALWPLSGSSPTAATLIGGASGGARERWLGGSSGELVDRMVERSQLNAEFGLGSSYIPYLIVSATSVNTAAEVKSAVVASMESYRSGGALTLYSVLHLEPFALGTGTVKPGAGFTPVAVKNGEIVAASSVGEGSSLSTYANVTDSAFFSGLDPADVVLENPCGLLGSWTGSSMESVLEAVWLAEAYSCVPEGSQVYEPVTNMDDFSVKIGETDCSDLRKTVLAFYETFYRYEASWAYKSIVTEKGL